jgi:hypothetical protein
MGLIFASRASEFPPPNCGCAGFAIRKSVDGVDLVRRHYDGGRRHGNAYFSGWTHSSDFPLTPGAFQNKPTHVKVPAAQIGGINERGARRIQLGHVCIRVAIGAHFQPACASSKRSFLGYTCCRRGRSQSSGRGRCRCRLCKWNRPARSHQDSAWQRSCLRSLCRRRRKPVGRRLL